ncbi:MAG: hypothetical protein NTU88_00590 [Armatimonadetes bacterium]|nr:hypothetical protein [Armatimonadota bacterium]
MAITITRAEIKRKCMIPSSDTTYDSDIDALIIEMQPSVEYTIADVYLNDTSNTKLQAVLKLGILEVMSGEALQQLRREPGVSEDLSVAGVSIGARKDHGATLIEQGTSRLQPFRKIAEETADGSAISSTTSGTDRTFTSDAMEVW